MAYRMDMAMDRPLIQWRAVFGGVIVGLATMVMLTSLWLALAYGSEMETVRANLDWYIGGSAIGVMFLSGLLAGWMSGVRGLAAGLVNGATLWGLTVIAVLTIGVPSAISAVGVNEVTVAPTDTAWVAFWSILIAFGTATIGGALGGLIPHPARASMVTDRDVAVRDHEHDDHDHDQMDDEERRIHEARHRAERTRAAS